MTHTPHPGASGEVVECRECGADFRLDLQRYHDDVCPDCVTPKRRNWATCAECGDKIHPDEEERVRRKVMTGMGTKKNSVLVHEGECADEAKTVHRHRPP